MFEHKIMRNQELMSSWRQYLKRVMDSEAYKGRGEVIDGVLAGGTPRYDVSYDYAVRVMYWMLRDHRPAPCRRSLKRQMWEEISRHVRRTIERRGCSIPEAVAVVLAEKKASRYFISQKQASKIIYHEIRNSRTRRRNA